MDDGGDDVTELAAVKEAKVGLPAAPALSLDRLGFRDVGDDFSFLFRFASICFFCVLIL